MAKNTNNKQIFVERETFEKDGRTFFSYFIKGNIRGQRRQGSRRSARQRRYTVLDIVFGDQMAAQLVAKPFEIKDDATGKIIAGNTYSVQTVDENGEIYECAVKPYRSSDKSMLNMLLR